MQAWCLVSIVLLALVIISLPFTLRAATKIGAEAGFRRGVEAGWRLAKDGRSLAEAKEIADAAIVISNSTRSSTPREPSS
jgi:hypothetical protein